MQAVTAWISVVGLVLVVAYLVSPGSKAGEVLKALGEASSSNVRALAGGVNSGYGGGHGKV